VMALLLTGIFTLGFLRRGPWTSVLAFFAIVFLAAWAGSLWLSPAGPIFYGIYWLPIVFTALLVALLLAGSVTRRHPPRVEAISEVKRQERVIESMFDAFFWTLLVVLVLAIILGYLVERPAT
jgi:predicted lysophospholipase L1 biosynthesis ABC-type transport system permease subunit